MALAAVTPGGGGSPSPGKARFLEPMVCVELWARYNTTLKGFQILAKQARSVGPLSTGGGGTNPFNNVYYTGGAKGEYTVNAGAYQRLSLVRSADGKLTSFFELTYSTDTSIKSGILECPIFTYEGVDLDDVAPPHLVLTWPEPAEDALGAFVPPAPIPVKRSFRRWLHQLTAG